MGADPAGPGASTAAARRPDGPYSLAGVGPNRPSVGVPAAAARCISPESLPTNKAQRAKQADASGKDSRPVRSTASARAASTGAAIGIVKAGDEGLDENFVDSILRVPATHDTFMPVLSIVPMQLLAYYIAADLGREIDQPRNLAKSVTVE